MPASHDLKIETSCTIMTSSVKKYPYPVCNPDNRAAGKKSFLELHTKRVIQHNFDGYHLSHILCRFSRLKRLKFLNIRRNNFESIPTCIYQLNELQNLNASGNKLTNIEAEIMTLPKLEVLGLNGCSTLRSPPSEVCEQGLKSIRQYFVDLSTGVRKTIPAVTMAVIGQKMSGKTSLIKTLQNKQRKRVLTNREPSAAYDEATKV